MPSFYQLAQIQGRPGEHLFEAARELLNDLLLGLYARSAGRDFQFPAGLVVVDEPELARKIFKETDRFVKNYTFLSDWAPGRLSENGADQVTRAALTQHFYASATKRLSATRIESVYTKHLLGVDDAQDLFEPFVAAAVELVSYAYGLSKTIIWPRSLVARAREHLQMFQALMWVASPPSWRAFALNGLAMFKDELFELWQGDAEMLGFIDGMAFRGGASRVFVMEELLQNLFAATETTASSLSWMASVLSRNHGLYEQLLGQGEQERQFFINEALRVFPPVPLVTRLCVSSSPDNSDAFQADQPLIVSIVGLHTNTVDWTNPLSFSPGRKEWLTSTIPKSYMPFLYGPRVCGGKKLAEIELAIGLRALLKNVTIAKVFSPLKFTYALTSRPG